LIAFEGSGKNLAIGADMVAWCRANHANLSVVNCGAAKHNAPEDQPEEIAQSLGKWLEQINI
jgi:haloalkane dehalogenase